MLVMRNLNPIYVCSHEIMSIYMLCHRSHLTYQMLDRLCISFPIEAAGLDSCCAYTLGVIGVNSLRVCPHLLCLKLGNFNKSQTKLTHYLTDILLGLDQNFGLQKRAEVNI